MLPNCIAPPCFKPVSTQNQALLCRVAADEVHSAAVWEMFYCMAAYEGLMDAQICVGVCDGSLRPHFNESCPLPYQKLAMQCWAQNPEDRHAYLLLAATAQAHVYTVLPICAFPALTTDSTVV